MTDSRAHAVALARRNFRVFRVESIENKPAYAGWIERASSDPDKVFRDFTDILTGESVADNPGILTGDDLLVVDSDHKNGTRNGKLSHMELVGEGLPSNTLTVRTSSGGTHSYFRVPQDREFRNRVGWREHVDIRCHHGFVTAPGAIRNGVAYEIVNDAPIADLPAQFVEELSRPRGIRQPLTDFETKFEDDWSIAAAIVVLAAVPADEGQRHSALIAAMHKCFDLGVTPDTLEGLIEQHVEWFGDLYTQDLSAELDSVTKGRIRDGKQWGVEHPRAQPSAYAVFEKVALGNAEDEKPKGGDALEIISAAEFAGKTPDPVPWLVPDLIADETVTLITGDGGVGKSLLGLQLFVSIVAGRQWLGMNVKRGPVLFLSAEDPVKVLHNRLLQITEAEGVDMADLADLRILPRADLDAVLGEPDGKGGIKPTKLWRRIEKAIERIKPVAVMFDTLADVFAGNEIVRTEVRQFISMCRALASRNQCSVILAAHPSVDGMKTGRGTSGSTAWSNSVRSLLYLTKPDKEDERRRDPNLRLLTTMKQNYAAGVGDERELRWTEGRFVISAARVVAEADVETKALELIAKLASQGRNLTLTPGVSYAPKLLNAECRDFNSKVFADAIDRLITTNLVYWEEYGSPSRVRKRLAARLVK